MAFGMASRSIRRAPSTDCSTSTACGGIRPAPSRSGTTAAERRPAVIRANGISGPDSSMRSGRCWKSSSAMGGAGSWERPAGKGRREDQPGSLLAAPCSPTNWS